VVGGWSISISLVRWNWVVQTVITNQLSRRQIRAKYMFDRGILQRGEALRRPTLPQDTSIPFSKRPQLRTAVVDLVAPTEVQESKAASPARPLQAASDAFLDIPAILEEGMQLGIWHKVAALRCDEVSRKVDVLIHLLNNQQQNLRFLHGIFDFWSSLVLGDKRAMMKVDPDTVKEVGLKAPWASALDAQALRSQVLGGAIFSKFTRDEREEIWRKISAFRSLVPSLRSFFRNSYYMEKCVNCIERLTGPYAGKTVFTALEEAFDGTNLGTAHMAIQVMESEFSSRSADRLDLGCRQLYAYTMRHFLDMPREPQVRDRRALSTAKADRAVLRDFADLASPLGFDTPEIRELKQHQYAPVRTLSSERTSPLLITEGPGEDIERRCGIPSMEAYEADKQFLFIDYLHDTREEQGEGITSFFVRKSMYLDFFGRPEPITTSPVDKSAIPQHFVAE